MDMHTLELKNVLEANGVRADASTLFLQQERAHITTAGDVLLYDGQPLDVALRSNPGITQRYRARNPVPRTMSEFCADQQSGKIPLSELHKVVICANDRQPLPASGNRLQYNAEGIGPTCGGWR